ncbi:hypothetical protein Vadar_031858 [Vaccinium darrowii]|uniref:Uncharacterized protein n=1 Tax=Vaccinium darrowii TaxID=229202 RepID=A0ACB7XUS3_9ERIC|nr:hypothetical protein Vadar_031858 [Vaccinium darrowii]
MATNFYSLPVSSCPLLLAFSFLLHLLLLTPTKTEAGGFTVDLIHRDSPQSPFYDTSITESDRLANAIRRSFSRVARFAGRPYNIQSPLFPSGGEYLMNFSIGTPPLKTSLLADTGSDLSWTQCQPCVKCYKQNLTIFDPKKSSTYKELPCISQPCRALRNSTCIKGTKGTPVCQYKYGYADKSYTIGDVAMDTFTFGSSSGRPVSVGNIVFGCGHNNGGTYDAATAGIIGLSGGSLSLVRQLGDSIDGKFSYCLPLDSHTLTFGSGKISFGDEAVVSGPGVVSTPFVIKGKFNYYYLTLESIIVGNKKLGYETKMPSETTSGSVGEEGNIIIDSGTVLTFLPSGIFQDLESQLSKVVKGKPFKDPAGGVFKLCYIDDNIDNYPPLTFKFKGAEVELHPLTTFFVVGKYLCLLIKKKVLMFGNGPY